jgi:hypothetical protein
VYLCVSVVCGANKSVARIRVWHVTETLCCQLSAKRGSAWLVRSCLFSFAAAIREPAFLAWRDEVVTL